MFKAFLYNTCLRRTHVDLFVTRKALQIGDVHTKRRLGVGELKEYLVWSRSLCVSFRSDNVLTRVKDVSFSDVLKTCQ